MPRSILQRICRWCEAPLDDSNRKYCSDECRREAQQAAQWNPTLDEIRAICRQIQQEGGERWQRQRTCYPPQPVRLREIHVSAFDDR